MRAVQLRGPYDLRVIEAGEPRPEPRQDLIQVRRCGICGSDLHAYKGRHPDYIMPLIIGHEFSGDVVEVGDGVTKVEVGDRVCVEPLLTCGECRFCLRGEYNRGVDLKVIGCQTDGAMAEYIAVDERWVYRLPEGMSYEEGAMMEPLAVAVHAVRRAPRLGDNVLVLGAGTIGLLTLQVARAMGAVNIVVTDLVDWRLELARKLGATEAVNPARESLEEVVEEVTGGVGVDTSFEAVGHEEVLRQALSLTRKGGDVVVIGVYEEPTPRVRIMDIVNKELNVYGSLVYNWDFETAIGLASSGRVDVKPLISDVVEMEEVVEGFKRMLAREEGVVKIQVRVS